MFGTHQFAVYVTGTGCLVERANGVMDTVRHAHDYSAQVPARTTASAAAPSLA